MNQILPIVSRDSATIRMSSGVTYVVRGDPRDGLASYRRVSAIAPPQGEVSTLRGAAAQGTAGSSMPGTQIDQTDPCRRAPKALNMYAAEAIRLARLWLP